MLGQLFSQRAQARTTLHLHSQGLLVDLQQPIQTFQVHHNPWSHRQRAAHEPAAAPIRDERGTMLSSECDEADYLLS